MPELASISIFAFPANEIEARLATRQSQARSGHFLLYRVGSTHAFTSAILDGKN